MTELPLRKLDSPAQLSEAETLGAAAVLNQIAEGVIVTDQAGRIVLVNDAAARLHGVKRLDVEPEDYTEVYHLLTLDGDPHPPEQLPLTRAVRTGETVTDARWRIRRPDGSEILAIGTARPLFNEAGEQRGAILTVRDDTARYRAERDTAESEARFRAMADSAPSPVWVTNAEGIEFANRAFEEFAGTPAAELTGETWTRIIHPEDLPRVRAVRDAAWESQAPYEFEARFKSANGEWLWLHTSSRPRLDAGGALLGYVGLAVDVTEARRAETALRESERRFRLIADSAPVPMWVTLPDRMRSFVNRAYVDFLGVSYEAAISFDWRTIIHPDDAKRIVAESVAGEASQKPFALEGRYRRGDGEWRWLRSTSQPRLGPDGESAGFIGVAHDITGAKENALALRERAEELQAVLDAVPAAIWIARDPDAREITGNRMSYDVLRLPPDVNASVSAVDEAARPTNFQIFKDGKVLTPDQMPVQLAASGVTVENFEEEIVFDDGQRIALFGNATPLRDAAGKIRGAVAAFVDITQFKQAEKALRVRSDEFNTLADNMPALCWMADATGSIFWYNSRWYEYTGTRLEQMEGWGWQSVHDPDMLPQVMERWQAAIASGEPFEMTFPLKNAQRTFGTFLTRVVPMRDEAGAIERWFGTNTDITEQQKQQQHLSLMVDELNHRVKNTLSIVQSLAQQTFRGEGVSQAARAGFEGRLSALAVAHNLLTRQNWESADLGDIIADALQACAIGRFTVDGPPVQLEPKTTVTIAMALHELCTNATKYGALSADGGSIKVTWSVSGGASPRLHMRWEESGGPAVITPTHRGFGTRMIERALASELRGDVRLHFFPAGVVCEIDAALPAIKERA